MVGGGAGDLEHLEVAPSLPRGAATATATGAPGGARMSAVASRDPFQPVLGDDIGPTTAQRVRSGVALAAILLVLGLLAALALGLALVVMWAIFTAALG